MSETEEMLACSVHCALDDAANIIFSDNKKKKNKINCKRNIIKLRSSFDPINATSTKHACFRFIRSFTSIIVRLNIKYKFIYKKVRINGECKYNKDIIHPCQLRAD